MKVSFLKSLLHKSNYVFGVQYLEHCIQKHRKILEPKTPKKTLHLTLKSGSRLCHFVRDF